MKMAKQKNEKKFKVEIEYTVDCEKYGNGNLKSERELWSGVLAGWDDISHKKITVSEAK